MGLRIHPPPISFGDECPICSPLRWAAGETPEFVYCTFYKIVDCGISAHPAPNGVILKMTQTPGFPCHWAKTTGLWRPDFQAKRAGAFGSQLRLFDEDGFSFFGDIFLQCPAEYFRYGNNQVACILFFAGSQGFGYVFWLDDVYELIDEFGLDPTHKLFHEVFNFNVAFNVLKFCDRYQRTNIRIKRVRM